MDYTYLYKHSYQRIDEIQNLLPYDIFISSYVNSQRVQEPADNIQAGQKIWFATEEEGRDLYLSGKDVTFVKANEDYAPITEKLEEPIKLATEIRKLGINTEIYFDNKKMKAKFKYADRLNIPYVLVIGEDEIKTGMYTIKDMTNGTHSIL